MINNDVTTCVFYWDPSLSLFINARCHNKSQNVNYCCITITLVTLTSHLIWWSNQVQLILCSETCTSGHAQYISTTVQCWAYIPTFLLCHLFSNSRCLIAMRWFLGVIWPFDKHRYFDRCISPVKLNLSISWSAW